MMLQRRPLGSGALASNITKLEDEVRSGLVKGWGQYSTKQEDRYLAGILIQINIIQVPR